MRTLSSPAQVATRTPITFDRRPLPLCAGVFFLIASSLLMTGVLLAQEHVLHRFDRIRLTDVYFSEGAGYGDLDGDGVGDAVYGPYWFAGPDFHSKREIYLPVPQPRERYADHFFHWVRDFNDDGRPDVLTVGFPGKPAYVYENPGPAGHGNVWPRHEIMDWVSNESPQFVQLVGDEQPELVFTRDGRYGYATYEPGRGFDAWRFHRISEQFASAQFGHGLGVGDVDGDGRMDVLFKDGWLEQPDSLAGDPPWTLHPAGFAAPGGADMYAYDVDGDGDNDVITSLAAHEFGLAWHEQVRTDGQIGFRQHLIVGDRPEQNRYGVVFSELHSVALADIDGDGLKDIVTGKTYWSHHRQSTMWDADAVVYWFRLVRDPHGVDFVPYLADTESGIGRQLTVGDINGDGLLDFIVGGMKGGHVLLHRRQTVDEPTWRASQPEPIEGYQEQVTAVRRPNVGPRQVLAVAGALEGESLGVLSVSTGSSSRQAMANFAGDRWSGDAQLFWRGGQRGGRLTLALPVAASGNYDLELVLTKARDYAVVQLWLDDERVGDSIDLYSPTVVTSGPLAFRDLALTEGLHRLSIEIVGANPLATPANFVGLDYLRLSAATAPAP